MFMVAMLVLMVMTAAALCTMLMGMLMMAMLVVLMFMMMTAAALCSMLMGMFMMAMLVVLMFMMVAAAALCTMLMGMFMVAMIMNFCMRLRSAFLSLSNQNIRLQRPGNLLNLRNQPVRIFCRNPQLFCGKGYGSLLYSRKLIDLSLNFGSTVGASQIF